MTIEILTPVGRLVSSHPMESTVKKDRKGNIKYQADGTTPQVSFYAGLAIVKEGPWWETDWGQKIYQAGLAAWPGGETDRQDFAWKITDGDSTVPNKKGKIPNQREGWPGHWIIHASDGFAPGCFHTGKFQPHEQIQNKAEIKPGDYGRMVLHVKSNDSTDSPGVYVNLKIFEMFQAGELIQLSSGPDAAEVLGGSDAAAPVLPAGAKLMTTASGPGAGQAATSTPSGPGQSATTPSGPAAGFSNVPAGPSGPGGPGAGPSTPAGPAAEQKYLDSNGDAWTEAQLIAGGYNPAQIQGLQKA